MSKEIAAIKHALRDFQTDGVMASGLYPIKKDELRAALDLLDKLLSAIASGLTGYDTKLSLDAATGGEDGALAYTYRDPVSENNSVWQWNLAAAEWERADWYLNAAAAYESARAQAVEEELQSQIAGSTTDQGATADGTSTSSSGGLSLFANLPISDDGRLSFRVWSALADSNCKLLLASKNAANQFTLVDSMPVGLSPGLNLFETEWREKAGLYVGLYCAQKSHRFTTTGGPGAFVLTSGVPAIDSPSNALANWLVAIGWTMENGIDPRLVRVENRLASFEKGSGGIETLIHAEQEPLTTAVAKRDVTVIGYYGQSNSSSYYQGSTPSAPLSTAQPFDNVMYADGQLVDLVSVGTEKSHVTAANMATALRIMNGWTVAGEVLAAFTAGVPGAALSELQSGSNGYNNYLARLAELKGVESDIALPVMPFIQGETDIALATPQATWRGAMETLRDNIEAAAQGVLGTTDTLHVLMMQPSANILKAGAGTGCLNAQLALAQEDERFFLVGAPMHRIPTSTYDYIHGTNIGFKLQGAYIAKGVATLLGGHKPQWLDPVSATYRGDELRIRFRVPVKPLRLDPIALGVTKDHGFRVIANGATATIVSISVDDETVVIVCSEPLSGPVSVRCALDYLGSSKTTIYGASCTLRDSDPLSIDISGKRYQLYNCAPHFEMAATNIAV